MADIQPIGPTESGTNTRAKINEAIDRVNRVDDVVAKVDETVSDLILAVGYDNRPADARVLFTASLTGSGKEQEPIDFGQAVTNADGTALRVTSTGGDPIVVASRVDQAAEAGVTYAARVAVRRNKNTSDPLGDTVQFGIACLNAAKQKVSERIFFEGSVVTADGLISRQVTFSRDQEAEITLSDTTRYVRPFVRIFGGDGITDVVTVGALASAGLPGAKGDTGDVTPVLKQYRDEVISIGGDVAKTHTRLDSIEATQSSDRVIRATYAELAALSGFAGQGGEVLDADTGTHTDPVVGGTVPNAGVFTYSTSPAGWKRIGSTGIASTTGIAKEGRTIAIDASSRISSAEPKLSALQMQLSVPTPSVKGSASYRIYTLDNGTRIALPTFVPVEPTDLFVLIGQSNTEGRGNSAESPAAPRGIEYLGGVLKPFADPVGGALTGSMWPAWSNEWFAQKARYSAFVEMAVGGTGLLTGAGGEWSPSGSLRAAAVAGANAAIAAISASADYVIGNVYFVWCQGENEAANYNGTTVSDSAYSTALIALADYFKAQIPAMQQMFVVQSAAPTDAVGKATLLPEVPGLERIGKAQAQAAATSALISLVYAGTSAFNVTGKMKDGLHFNQSGLNLAGKIGARRAALGPQNPDIAAPGITGFTSVPDTAGSDSSKTIPLTTHTSTKSIVVFVHATRGTVPVLDAKFNGVSMTLLSGAQKIVGQVLPSSSHLRAFILTEKEYGASLSGVTANLVVSSSATVFSLQCAVYQLDAIVLPCAPSGNVQTIGAISQTHSIFSTPASVVLSVAIATATAAQTVVFTGLDEDMDASVAGNPGFAMLAAGHKTVAALTDTQITATYSGTCDYIASLSVPIRQLFDGES